jgi:tetratricopeptide (TPR) repeat protein
MNNRVPAGLHDRRIEWPVRSGAVPPLAESYAARPESAPDLQEALVPGATVVLTPRVATPAGSREWLGCCGKTQLAVAFAESLWASRRADLLVWVNAASRASVLTGYVAAAVATGTSIAGDAESAAGRFVSWLGETSRPWLVVLDDLREAKDLEGLLPECPAGRVLITTESPAMLSTRRRPLALAVNVFSTREAFGYLMGRLAADTDLRLGALDLVEHLGREPMALAHASAVITSSELSCRDYLSQFVRRRTQLEAYGNGLCAASVTWTLSVEHGERLSRGGGAQLLLVLAALLDGSGIPATVFTTAAACEYLRRGGAAAAADPARARDTVLGLERAGLLTVEPGCSPPIVRISPALQQAVRAAMPDALLKSAATAAADALTEAWPKSEPGERDHPLEWPATGLRACAASLLAATADILWAGGRPHPLLGQAGQSLDAARLTGPAVAYWTRLATTSERLLGLDSQDTLMMGSCLAEALLAAGRPSEAMPWCHWVLADPLQAVRPDNAAIRSAQVSLGRALLATGKPDDAVAVLKAALSQLEHAGTADRPAALRTRDELAAAYRAAGKPSDAIQLYQRTLTIRESVQGTRHPETIATRRHLADAYLAEGQAKAAISQYKRLLVDCERILGSDDLTTIAARSSLAAAYHLAGRMASAVQLFEEAAAGYEQVLGADHRDTLTCRARLADAYYAVGRLGDATVLLRDTVARCEQVMPPGDPLTMTARQTLADITG